MPQDATNQADTGPATADPAVRRAFWDRLLWQAAQHLGRPAELEQAVLHSDDLQALAGDEVYQVLFDWACFDETVLDMRPIHAAIFQRTCFCRRDSPMDENEIYFGRRNVYRCLYYNDECITRTTTPMFYRTPDIDLLRCDTCGDVWLRGKDMRWARQHYVLLEPGDLERIERDGVWPDGMDAYEDDWLKEGGGLSRHSAELAAWQAAHNSPEAMRRFGLLKHP
ncbi:MAG: hypothetical protein JWN71_5067 [Xanthobacteraceae bacterium]|jgi:hypothetical protein|nr:hypothetical protein [Xanthobacteraceae bacterium]